ncbi:hypothetical protein TNCV_5052291 [Trichonephila clavipes]|nr:hypothetical protein TNCV_5052291 [Trichonephila clavipes]
MAAGKERKGLPLGLVVCFFDGNLNPSSSTVALLTSDLETLLVLSEVLFSAEAVAFFCFEVTLATILPRAVWFGGTLKSEAFRVSNGNKFVVDGIEFTLEVAVLVSSGWNDGELAFTSCISHSEFEQLRYCRSIVSDKLIGLPFAWWGARSDLPFCTWSLEAAQGYFNDRKNIRELDPGRNQMEEVSIEFVCSVAHSKV